MKQSKINLRKEKIEEMDNEDDKNACHCGIFKLLGSQFDYWLWNLFIISNGCCCDIASSNSCKCLRNINRIGLAWHPGPCQGPWGKKIIELDQSCPLTPAHSQPFREAGHCNLKGSGGGEGINLDGMQSILGCVVQNSNSSYNFFTQVNFSGWEHAEVHSAASLNQCVRILPRSLFHLLYKL